jgi:hypothetical protein
MSHIKLRLAATADMVAMLSASAAPATAQGFCDCCVLIEFTLVYKPVFVCDTFVETSPGLTKLSYRERRCHAFVHG